MQKLSAVIDLGYNAIRGVVYESQFPGAPKIFSEKFKSDLGSLLSRDDLDIKHPIYLSIQYLLHIFEKIGVQQIYCVATAVLRDHPKAQDFLDYIQEKYKLKIEILSGQEEARLSAVGLIHGIGDCHGVAADLGGGSLELIEINHSEISHLSSLKLGTKIIAEQNLNQVDLIADLIIQDYGDKHYDNLYLIGGAMRFIGRLYLDFIQHPIKNLHNLQIKSEDFIAYLDGILSSSNHPRNKLNRRKVNIYAILVAKAMIQVFHPKQIIISTYGLKEGVHFEHLAIPYHHILEEKVAYSCNYDLSITKFDIYAKILWDIIPQTEDLYRILKLSIIFNSLKREFDETLPPRALVEYILAAEMPIEPKLRVMLALVADAASDFPSNKDIIMLSKRILSKKEYLHSQVIAHFIAIAEIVDGPVFTSPSFDITSENGYYELKYDNILPRVIFERVRFRLKQIAQIIRVSTEKD